MLEGRLRLQELANRVMNSDSAAREIEDGMTVATSGFTPAGYPKAVPLALARRGQIGDALKITLITGASVGDELDGVLARAGILGRRYPYQTNNSARDSINDGDLPYQDFHLSLVPQFLDYGYFGEVDMAIIEALAITETGGIIPTTSVGISPTAVKKARKVIVEVNTSQPMALEGVHDIYLPERPPNRKPIPILHPGDRIGTSYIPCDPAKIAAIVITDIPDSHRPLGPIDTASRSISRHIIDFLEDEIASKRLPENLLPLQSGVGSVANAVFNGLVDSDFHELTCYTEVIQDSMLDLIDAGKVSVVSGCSFTPSEKGASRLIDDMNHYAKHCVLRPQEISNNPEVIRRLGVIAMNTAIEVDIYGHVNSTNIMGSRIVNGLGGSGDFARNAALSIFSTVSTAKDGNISAIVPMVSHVDHPEHDVHVIVTEQGIADLRGTSPRERARLIIENCAHPDYKDLLWEYLRRAEQGQFKHEPHVLNEALSWHCRYLKKGSMK